MKPIIKVENLSKQYRLGTIGAGTVREDFQRWLHRIQGKEDPFLKVGETNDRSRKGTSDYVWALKDINFEVMPGEVLGIIGKNGAGKSTLLKILSKVTGPTTGRIDYNGRIGSLLEVGTGFHPELTGRENIFLNGAILGMTKREIRTKLDEIIDFSGCERYIDTPVKRYSSGMTVRLGFAIAAHLDPEILIVDEVLAVGDAEFQKKAIGKMKEVSQLEGRTVLFVSHNIEAIRKLCSQGLILKNGEVSYAGPIEKAIQQYNKVYFDIQKTSWASSEEAMPSMTACHINRFFLVDPNERHQPTACSDDTVEVGIDYTLLENRKDLTIGISVFDEEGRYILRTLHTDLNAEINNRQRLGKNSLVVTLDISFLKEGIYKLALDVSYHNSNWIVNPHEEIDRVLILKKEKHQAFSSMHASNAVISPLMHWHLNN